jgi:hypothetical protein
MSRTEPTCSAEPTHRPTAAGSAERPCRRSTSPTQSRQQPRSGTAPWPSGDSPRRTTFPTTTIAGASNSTSPTSATSTDYTASHSINPERRPPRLARGMHLREHLATTRMHTTGRQHRQGHPSPTTRHDNVMCLSGTGEVMWEECGEKGPFAGFGASPVTRKPRDLQGFREWAILGRFAGHRPCLLAFSRGDPPRIPRAGTKLPDVSPERTAHVGNPRETRYCGCCVCCD